MIDGAIYVDGKVAVRYYQPVPKYVQINGKDYVCSVQRGVSLVFVPEEDVPALLGYLGGCCGGGKHVFSLAHQEAYNVYERGER